MYGGSLAVEVEAHEAVLVVVVEGLFGDGVVVGHCGWVWWVGGLVGSVENCECCGCRDAVVAGMDSGRREEGVVQKNCKNRRLSGEKGYFRIL